MVLKRLSLGYMKNLLPVYSIKSRAYGVYQCFQCTLSSLVFFLESGHLILSLISAAQYVAFKKSLTACGPQFLICK